MELLGVARHRPQRRLDLGERVGVDQLAQLLLAEQLAQQVAVERERLRTPLRRRRVVLVHVRRDVVEEQRRRERRRRRRLDVDEVELTRAQPAEQPLQRRQVEHVLQALAVRLEHDREARVLARDLEQALRLEPLLPERRPLAGPAPRDQQRARRVLAEARAEERRLPHLGEHEILELVRREQQEVGRRRRVGVGQVEGDAVVRPDRLHLDPERLAQPRADGHRPRRVHARAERREDADAPVADLVAEPLDDDGAVRRDGAGRPLLLAEEGGQVRRREPRRRSSETLDSSRLRRRSSSRANFPIASPSSYGRPMPSPFQNGTAPGTPGAGETSTRSRVISSIRHDEAPSTITWPARAS